MNVDHFQELLIQSNYDHNETTKLTEGFRQGFRLEYTGQQKNIQQNSPNLPFTMGDKKELWNKIMKEVQLARYAGPFQNPPFTDFIQSPIGLVPKDGGRATRLIFHLSHPRIKPFKDRPQPQQRSINANTDKEKTTVHYPDFDDAVRMCLKLGGEEVVYFGKSDFKSAFRHLGIHPDDWMLLVMKAESPLDGKYYYFVDKCLPFGASISCAHFQSFSNAVVHIFRFKTLNDVLNYLDDFFFAALQKMACDLQIRQFLDICEYICFPVSMEKTYWGTTRLVFLGILMDSQLKMVFIPIEKIETAQNIITDMLKRNNKKTTLKELQRICGILNFFSKCIIPARSFTRRLYGKMARFKQILKPTHHIDIDQEMRLDLELWLRFLNHPTVFNRPFADFEQALEAEDIHMYTDSSRNPKLGCGGVNEDQWFMQQWNSEFIEKYMPSINYLELYAVTVAVVSWIHKYQNRRVNLFCDNESVVHMINNATSSCKNCMVLISVIVLFGLFNNIRVSAKHVSSADNIVSDCLSRLKIRQFNSITKNAYNVRNRTEIPQFMWPMDKIWLK